MKEKEANEAKNTIRKINTKQSKRQIQRQI